MKIHELVVNKKYKMPIYYGKIVVTYIGMVDGKRKLHFICQKQLNWYYPRVNYIPAEEVSPLELELY